MRWVLLFLALWAVPAQAERVTVPVTFQVDPASAEIWLVRDHGYEYLGSADQPGVFVELDRQDLGRTPCVFRIFHRRPWERNKKVPARAHSVTLLLRGEPVTWPPDGSFSLPLVDRLLAARSFQIGIGVLLLSGVLLLLWRRAAFRRRAEREAQRRLLESAEALNSALRRDQLLAFTETSIRRAVAHDVGIIGQERTVLADWGHDQEKVFLGRLSEVLGFLAQTGDILRVADLEDSIFAPPVDGMASLLAVPLEGGGGLVLLARERSAFASADEALLRLLAAHIGRALHGYQRQLEEFLASKEAAVGQLAAGVAHELNNPLGAVLLAVDTAICRAERHPEKVGTSLGMAATAVSRAQRIVNDLLLYSRETLENGDHVNLNDLVESAVVSWTGELGSIRLTTRLSPSLPEVIAEPDLLLEALNHLVRNARDALSGGSEGGEIRISTWAEGEEVFLEVRDDGIGMTSEVLERAFEPFYTTQPVGKGIGLGLSVGRRVMRIHGGDLKATARPGEGSQLLATLPKSASTA